MKRVHISIPNIVLLVLITLTSVAALSVVGCDGPRSADVMAQGPITDNALQEQLLASERQFWGALQARDAATIRRLSGVDGFFVSPLNIRPIEETIGGMTNYTVGEFALGPRVHLQRISDDAAILVYDFKVGFPSPSQDWLMTAVYVNRSGQWVGIYRAETRGNPPRPE